MKRLLFVITILVLLVGRTYAFEEFDNGYKMYVRTSVIKTSSLEDGKRTDAVHNEYYLYIGTEETEKMDKEMAENHIQIGYMLSHPPKESTYNYPGAPGNWYVQLTDTTRGLNVVAPVFRSDVWPTIPQVVKHILVALNYKDENLILISTNAVSGSISILYHPKFDRFKIFYNIKLKILERYFDKNSYHEQVPILIEPKMVI